MLRPLRAAPPAGTNVFLWGKQVRGVYIGLTFRRFMISHVLPLQVDPTIFMSVGVQAVDETKALAGLQEELEAPSRNAMANAHVDRLTTVIPSSTAGRRRAMRSKKMWARW